MSAFAAATKCCAQDGAGHRDARQQTPSQHADCDEARRSSAGVTGLITSSAFPRVIAGDRPGDLGLFAPGIAQGTVAASA